MNEREFREQYAALQERVAVSPGVEAGDGRVHRARRAPRPAQARGRASLPPCGETLGQGGGLPAGRRARHRGDAGPPRTFQGRERIGQRA